MPRVLITGMSGAGKSAVIAELAARGYRAHDLDTPEWSEWIDSDPADDLTPADTKDWVWRQDRVRALLSEPFDGMLFIGGCARNMGQFYALIDTVILLSAPVATIMARLKARMADAYGHTEEERRKVAALIATVEPLLRTSADHEIDTRKPVGVAVDQILRLVHGAK